MHALYIALHNKSVVSEYLIVYYTYIIAFRYYCKVPVQCTFADWTSATIATAALKNHTD